jgi:murein DD-endopeptidase MepM/ murein hydrolase activator NlpD
MSRRMVVWVVWAVSFAGVSPPAWAAVVPCLAPPVAGEVTDPFREPTCPYCAGNRGLEYLTSPGAPVGAAAAGRVTFAGRVAGVTYVVLEHSGGLRTTYGRLAGAVVQVGEVLGRGDRLGTTAAATFFGVRDGEIYLDPAPYLGVVVPRPQLVPLNGRNRRPTRPGELVCPT